MTEVMIFIMGIETILLLILVIRFSIQNFRKIRNWFFSLCSNKLWKKISKKLSPEDFRQIMGFWYSRSIKAGIELWLKDIAITFGKKSVMMWTAEKYGLTFVYGVDEKSEILVANGDLIVFSSKDKCFNPFFKNQIKIIYKEVLEKYKEELFSPLGLYGDHKENDEPLL